MLTPWPNDNKKEFFWSSKDIACTPAGTQTRKEGIDNRFCPEIQKSFSAEKV